MRAELIGHFNPCMTDIYLHIIDARMRGCGCPLPSYAL
eukprot:COSAG05_NODE_2320_length_3240_cov_2.007641_2_plen_38_part_00